jgi:hypothetical protein
VSSPLQALSSAPRRSEVASPGVQALKWRWISTTAAVFAVVAALAPASAGALTFGADLNQQVNLPLITCEAGVLNQFLGAFWPGTGRSSCLWSSVAIGSTQALTPPTGGTVTTVRVRAGATTGPMQVDVVRFLTRNTATPGRPEVACCFLQKYGPVFTPQANAITTVPTDLPVQEDPFPGPEDETTIAANDQLALAVLAPNVPVPVFATQNGQNDLNVLSYAWYPAPTPQEVPEPGPNPIGGFADLSGFQVLMNADLDTGGGGGGAGGGGAPGAGAPAGVGGGGGAPAAPAVLPTILLPTKPIPVKGNTATVPIQCLVLDCAGTLALQSAQQAGLASVASRSKRRKGKKPATVTYGSARFSVAAGKSAKIKVKLGGAGRKLLKHRHSVKVWANVTFTAGGGKPTSVAVTLKG